MEATKYGIIWSQNVHFITTLTVPLMGTGVLYHTIDELKIHVLLDNI